MSIGRNILWIGALLLIAGVSTAIVSYSPTPVLQYLFIGVSMAAGFLAVAIGKKVYENFVRSRYYLWIGGVLFLLATSMAIWATTSSAFVNVLGLFFLVLGMLEFVFV